MLIELTAHGLAPARITGSSAGALIGGLWASGLQANDLGEELLRLTRTDFWDPTPGLGLLRGTRFRKKLLSLLPEERIEQARVPVSISVYDVLTRSTRVLSEGSMAAAIHASCAVPFLFHPVWIGGRPYLDGGIADRPGLFAVPEGERVFYHHLSSRSPWRKRGSPSLAIPKRDGLTSLVMNDLPRVGPFKLEMGRLALEEARVRTRAALNMPIQNSIVQL